MWSQRRLAYIQKGLSPAVGPSSAPAATAPGPLDGIVVIDAGQAITGPLAAMMLGDMGATVIKIENPNGMGDLNRPVGPMRNGRGVYFHNFNRGKQGIVLDMKLPSAQAALKRLASTADVFIENSRPGAFDRMGLSYEDMKAVNPNLIYVSISGFGSTGPYAGRPAYDAVLQPMLGFPVMQGEANGQNSPPQLLNNYQVDKLTSWNTVQAVCAALFARERGKSDGGQHIEIAMLDVGANFFWPDGMALTGEMLVDKDPTTLSGSRPSRRPPQVLMPTKDGHGVLMIWPEAPHFEKALNAILPELKDDPRFMKMPERGKNFREFQRLLAQKFLTQTNAELMEFFDKNDLPGNVVIDLSEFHEDPQVVHNELLVTNDYPDGVGAIREPRPAPLMSSTPLRVGGEAPTRGQDTRSVLLKAGFTRDEISVLQQEGVFGDKLE